MSNEKQLYIKPDELADELEKSQANNNEPTVKLCQMFLEMAQRFMRRQNYQRYPQCEKDDMAYYCLEKCLKGIKHYKPERRKTCFSYYTRAIQNATLDWLDRHYYRHLNIKRNLTRRYAEEIAQYNPQVSQQLLQGILEDNTTGVLTDADKGKWRNIKT